MLAQPVVDVHGDETKERVAPEPAQERSSRLLMDSALLTTLALGALYVIGVFYHSGYLLALGVPAEVVTIAWEEHVFAGGSALFLAAGNVVTVISTSLLLAFAFGGLHQRRLRRRADAGLPPRGAAARFVGNLLDPRKVAARLPRWIAPLALIGMASAVLAAGLDGRTLTPDEQNVGSGLALLLTLAGWGVLVAFFVVVGRDRPVRPWSAIETARRGGPLVQGFVVAAAVLFAGGYAFGLATTQVGSGLMSSMDAATAGETAFFPVASFTMKETRSPYHEAPLLIVFQAESGYFVRVWDFDAAAPGTLAFVSSEAVASVEYLDR